MRDIRIGFAIDTHRLIPGDYLILGGVKIPFNLKSDAHSDGDCLYHAVGEALIGAVAKGDLGMHFPSNDSSCEGIDSSIIVEKAIELIESEGYHVSNIDCSIVLERPKLKEYILEMRNKLSELLKVDINRVSIKAGTNEGMDAVGQMKAITCYATVLISNQR